LRRRPINGSKERRKAVADLEKEVEAMILAGLGDAEQNNTTGNMQSQEDSTEQERRVIDVDLYRFPGGAVLLVPGGTSSPLDRNAVESEAPQTDPDTGEEPEQGNTNEDEAYTASELGQTCNAMHEDVLPRKPGYSTPVAFLALLCIFAIVGISIFTATPASKEVSFTLSIQGFHLQPASKSVRVTAIATGKGHTPPTAAKGTINFYNGAIYTQIIPIGTKLTGSDGISVITDQEAVIPPAAQTIPPIYGHTNFPAHSLIAGAVGNIRAGDINMACCVTSVIAQNPYNFTGGTNARDFTYLTAQDVKNTASSLLPTLRAETLSLLPLPQLNPTCSPVTTSSPGVGKEATSVVLIIVETCSASSYSVATVSHTITTYSKQFGKGTLTHVQFFVVGVMEKKGVIVTLYVLGRWHPFTISSFPNSGK
jgi:hypothetical protein